MLRPMATNDSETLSALSHNRGRRDKRGTHVTLGKPQDRVVQSDAVRCNFQQTASGTSNFVQ